MSFNDRYNKINRKYFDYYYMVFLNYTPYYNKNVTSKFAGSVNVGEFTILSNWGFGVVWSIEIFPITNFIIYV